MASTVSLRDVTESDLPIFFAHQLDPEAVRMAAFPVRNHERGDPVKQAQTREELTDLGKEQRPVNSPC